MNVIAQSLLDGVLMAAIYLPLVLGLTLIFGVLGVVNFAHAEVFAILLYLAYLLRFPDVPFYLLVPILVALAAVIGAGLHVGLIKPLLRKSADAQIVITLGISVFIQSALLLTASSTPRTVSTSITTSAFSIGPATVRYSFLIAAVVGLLFALVVDRVVHGTTFGTKLRATAHNADMASLMGINTGRVALGATVLGIAGLGLAAATMLPFVVVDPTLGQRYIIPIFSIVILAGLGSTRGVFVGALVFALLETTSAATLPIALSNLVPLLAIAALLLIKPTGLFARGRAT